MDKLTVYRTIQTIKVAYRTCLSCDRSLLLYQKGTQSV